VYTNFTTNATAAQINAAIAACPSNQVVKLTNGTFNLSGSIVFATKSGVVLKGAGTNTVLDFADGGIQMGEDAYYQPYFGSKLFTGTATVTNGFSQGGSNLLVDAVSNLVVGEIVGLEQPDDNILVTATGYEDAPETPPFYSQVQFTRVRAIAGNTVTIWPPVLMPNFSAALGVRLSWFRPWGRRNGLEDFTIDGTDTGGLTGYGANIYINCNAEPWVDNVKSIRPKGVHVYFCAVLCGEVRHCHFYDGQTHASMSYGILQQFCSSALVEDNIFERVSAMLMNGQASTGDAWVYNYCTNSYFTAANNWLMPNFWAHRAHPCMILQEGNYGNGSTADFIHGSSSHNLLFRNRYTGWEAYSYPSGPTAQDMNVLTLRNTNHYWSIVGNILGRTGTHTYYESAVGGESHDGTVGDAAIYDIGWHRSAYDNDVYWHKYSVDGPWPDDPVTLSTSYRHMNYDVVTTTNNGIVWCTTNADRTLPNSMIYASKPSYFGALSWPPFDPGTPSTGTNAGAWTNIPAGYRYVYGVDPPGTWVRTTPVANVGVLNVGY